MDPRVSFSALILVLSLAVAHGAGSKSVKFTYSGSTGPAKWASLSPSYSACSSGKSQSPVNIIKDQTVHSKGLKPLIRNYSPVNATLANNGFNVGVHYESNCGVLNVDGKKFKLKQMHWHSPSEHRIDGVQYPAELHLVHIADDGSYSVVAILYQYSDSPDQFIAKIHESLDKLAKMETTGDEHASVPLGILDIKLLSKATRKYYRYVGSLTTPPCTENVTWNILGKVRRISMEQLEALKAPLDKTYKINCRPLQLLNGRKIEVYDEAKNEINPRETLDYVNV